MKTTKQRYALKILKKELLQEDKDLESVQTEKSVLKMSTNHPFLVQLYSCFQTASHLFYAIEFVPGGDLMHLMQKNGILCEDYARFYAAEISLAIRFLHENGVIYRDLKLDNVLLAQDGHIKLTDYGMCKQNSKEDENASTFCGTPNYMAPEIVNNEKYSYSVDWWALGVLLYEMMTGHSPFRPDDISEDILTEEDMFRNILTKALKPPRNLSLRAAKVIRDFLNRDPESRLGSKRTGSFKEITDHLFFASIDWEALKLKQVKPPLLPKIISEQDLTNFPNEFTNQSLTLTPDKISAIDKVDESEFHEFQGFEYINPVLVRMDDIDHI
jgi:serine/threonine protein kinase